MQQSQFYPSFSLGFKPREASTRTRPAAGQVEVSSACLSSQSTTGNFQIALWLCIAQGGEKSDVPTAFLPFSV